jgi:hypothetical protein
MEVTRMVSQNAERPATGAVVAFPTTATAPSRGLLITNDQPLVRAFRRELRNCLGEDACVDVEPSIEEAQAAGLEGYGWVTLDLEHAVPPADAVRLARQAWPETRLAVLSYWWSERDLLARRLADLVIHKPLRAHELRGLFRPVPPAGDAPERPRTATGT